MNVIIVEDEHILLNHMFKLVQELLPDAKISSFENYLLATSFIHNNKIDIAFLDIQIGTHSGLDIAKSIHSKNPKANIIITTGYDEYAVKAFDLNVSSYLLKPITKKSLEKALNNLRYPLETTEQTELTAQCFGNFEFFVNSKPMEFKFNKTKELLAYLIYKRGTLCSNQEIISVLWEDFKDHNSYFKQLRQDLDKTLAYYKCEQILVRQRGKMGICTHLINCDYYDYLNGKEPLVKEFMAQYSWAEEVTALLN